MTCAALVLYLFAFALQAVGAFGVIQDVRRAIRVSREFRQDWERAKAIGWPEPAQEALAKHANAQNEVSDLQRWTAVGLLLGGVVVGLVANVVALYA